jgi:hypothetical protein
MDSLFRPEWIAMALIIWGVVRNIQKKRDGFAIWLVANLLWIYVQAQAQVWGMVVCQGVFCLTCCWGWWAWRPQNSDKVEPFQLPRDPDDHGYFVMTRGCSGDPVEVLSDVSLAEAGDRLWRMRLSDQLGHQWIERDGYRTKKVGS